MTYSNVISLNTSQALKWKTNLCKDIDSGIPGTDSRVKSSFQLAICFLRIKKEQGIAAVSKTMFHYSGLYHKISLLRISHSIPFQSSIGVI